MNDTFKIAYLYLGFTIGNIICIPGEGWFTPLGIPELQLFGREQITQERQYPPGSTGSILFINTRSNHYWNIDWNKV